MNVGEKGLGFKSVFRYTDEPHIFSNGFSFKFVGPSAAGSSMDASRVPGMGFIVPHWVERASLPEGACAEHFKTAFYLPSKDQAAHQQTIQDLGKDVQPHILLFLRRVPRVAGTLLHDLGSA
jgi:hypothetical protein